VKNRDPDAAASASQGPPVDSRVAAAWWSASWRRRSEPRGARSERVGAALAGEPGNNAATIVVEDLAELVAGVGQDARQ